MPEAFSSSSCVICGQSEETIERLLYQCPWAPKGGLGHITTLIIEKKAVMNTESLMLIFS
jgi:hypothetical protein